MVKHLTLLSLAGKGGLPELSSAEQQKFYQLNMEHPEEVESEKLICVRCGYSNDSDASRCGDCKSPLDDFAASSPWEMGSATGSAYASPENWRIKPIVFWGVWVYFGPSAIWAISSVVHMLYSIAVGHSNGFYAEEAGFMLMTLAYGVLSIWAVYSVTKNYFKKNPHQSEDEPEGS